MTLGELLSHLEQNNIKLWVEGDRLRYKGAQGDVTTELLTELRNHKRALINRFREPDDTSAPSDAAETGLDSTTVDGLPLSFAQEPLWFLQQLQPNNASNHLASAYRLRGPMDSLALEQSLNDIVARHDILRTVFHPVDGVPRQLVLPSVAVKISEPSFVDGPNAEQQLQRQISNEIQTPFDLQQWPLLRVKLYRVEQQEHILLVVMHHIVSDGWSFGVLFHELTKLYQARVAGAVPQLPAVAQYADHVVQQRRDWRNGQFDSQLGYWKNQLRGRLPILELPTDRPRPAIQTYRGSRVFIELPRQQFLDLKAFSQRQGCSLFMSLMAAVQALLFRYTGQVDLTIGSPLSTRSRPELEQLIGLMLNMVVFRGQPDGDLPFIEFLRRTRKVCLDAYANQDVPFDKLVEVLQPQRDASRNPLFQVMLQLSASSNLDFPGFDVAPVKIDSRAAQFDLSIHLWESADALRGHFEYNTDLFDADTIERMAEHFTIMLNAIVSDPSQRLSRLPVLSNDERRQLLVEWNQTDSDYSDRCVHELFAARVAETPDKVAVTFHDEQLTYHQLNERANKLAHYLRQKTIGRGSLVGLCVDRSLDMLVGLLGILKSGAAYVPLDPIFPPERLQFMLDDAAVTSLITQQRLRPSFPKYDTKITCLDTEWDEIANQPTHDPQDVVTSSDLAYVIYTSGSTGRPKGVQVGHRGLVNFLASMSREPGMSQDDVWLSVTTVSFDISALELFLPLMLGAKVVLVDDATSSDGVALLKQLRASHASIMQATPSTWQLLVDAGWQDTLPLKILCGGEALPRNLANELLERGSSLWNMYGPTETTIWSSTKRIVDREGPVLIGPPIANTQFYVLDADLQPVPRGVPGELYIGGDGLAMGYLNRPELTNEKFVPNPFSGEAASRLYKTGDLVRSRQHGELEFLGRIDHQVKLRGFRIELGEIEAVLTQQSTVHQAAVMVREDQPGDKRLVAYVVPAEACDIRHDSLRAALRDRLPEYMVPSRFVELDALPTTPNGKIDRRALPKPAGERGTETVYKPPGSALEKTIAGVWQQLLQVKQIGLDDNFFDLGGHSLLMAQVQSRLQTALSRQLPIIELFRYPTVASLVQYLGGRDDAEVDTDVIQSRGKRQQQALRRRRAIAKDRG